MSADATKSYHCQRVLTGAKCVADTSSLHLSASHSSKLLHNFQTNAHTDPYLKRQVQDDRVSWGSELRSQLHEIFALVDIHIAPAQR